jgi:tetratricopeptide (TPR) repeat protein
MNQNKKIGMKKILIAGLLIASTSVMAQKNMTTNAAMVWKSYQSNMAAENVEAAEKDLLEAIDFITKSAAHETTMNDAKTLMYKGKIYCEAAKVGATSKNEALKAYGNAETNAEGLAAFEKSAKNDSKGRYEDDIADYCRNIRSVSYNSAVKLYEEKAYEASMQAFLASAEYGKAMGLTDSVALYYGGIAAIKAEQYEKALAAFTSTSNLGFELGTSATYLAEAYSKLDRTEDGEKALKALLAKNPGNKDVMIALINIYLGSGKKAEAEKVLSDAIALDPDNKELHYVVGTIYEGQERYEDAEKAYKKVLELDPAYNNALLGLGAVYFNKAATINGQINDLALGDPKEESLRKDMTANFEKALPYLEKANELTPNNIEILSSLRQAYYKTGNVEKAKEMKAQIDSLKK